MTDITFYDEYKQVILGCKLYIYDMHIRHIYDMQDVNFTYV